jgi:hypothetical protein
VYRWGECVGDVVGCSDELGQPGVEGWGGGRLETLSFALGGRVREAVGFPEVVVAGEVEEVVGDALEGYEVFGFED